jgi:DnaJ-class molecular chaperone
MNKKTRKSKTPEPPDNRSDYQKKGIKVLMEELKCNTLIRCPYCLGTGYTYMFHCTACQGHGVIDNRTFKYPIVSK